MRLFKLNTNSKRYIFISNTLETEQVSVLGIIKYLLSFWKPVIVIAVIFGILGIFSANSPKFFTSTSKVIPHGGAPPAPSLPVGLEDLLVASAAPTDVGIESFPAIIESRTFLFDLLEEQILSESHGGYIELGKYVGGLNPSTKMSRTIGKIKSLPNQFWKLFERKEKEVEVSDIESPQLKMPTDTLYVISPERFGLANVLKGQILVEGTTTISIQTTLPQAKMSTRLNNLVLEKLVEATVRIKTAKQQRDLKFAELQRDTARLKFEKSQDLLAQFNDENKGNQSAKVQSQIQRLNSDYSLYFDIYSGLATKVEMLKIELLESTPFYEVYERAYIPHTPSGGFSFSPIIKNVIMGIALGILWAFAYTGLVVFRIIKGKLSDTAFDRISE